uniref:Zn(2)-C6 fungal-type domain-containing protein n=1 Tax=Mycena chlorophos TaxID=658473 RepID=A0ABQ0LEK6_MYCCL|nr:predicted protein [Mycena chlorophos]
MYAIPSSRGLKVQGILALLLFFNSHSPLPPPEIAANNGPTVALLLKLQEAQDQSACGSSGPCNSEIFAHRVFKCIPAPDESTGRCLRCSRRNLECELAQGSIPSPSSSSYPSPTISHQYPPSSPMPSPGPSSAAFAPALPYTHSPPTNTRPRYGSGVPYPNLSLQEAYGAYGAASDPYAAPARHAYIAPPVHGPGIYRGMPMPPPSFDAGNIQMPAPAIAYPAHTPARARASYPQPIPRLSGRRHLAQDAGAGVAEDEERDASGEDGEYAP